jgi:hypothetical protein
MMEENTENLERKSDSSSGPGSLIGLLFPSNAFRLRSVTTDKRGTLFV